MKKLISLSLLLGIITGTINASMVLGNNDVIGEWKYEALTAPDGYQKGVIIFTDNKGTLEGEVKFDTGYRIQLKSVMIEGDILKLGLYVDYEYITIIAKVTGAKMEGTIDSSQGKMTLKAVKK